MSAAVLLPIAVTGDNILALKAEKVTSFDESIQLLAANMQATMTAANGVGIAAPQVFSTAAMFIMASKPNERYPTAPAMTPIVVINPTILAASELMESADEGCLSIPGQRINIWRHADIKVQYQQLNGNLVTQNLTGFIARIFQHEFDHLQGITLLERSVMDEQTQQELHA
ncbi:peptide deformylase [Shewanella sp. OMA3-2]|uniref:peptide deformylase n=1 Tax=Shewanella sp. OMA3-2 TaxID=2908650 RepID=UPI001F179E36|nr:peptide deformylase [Shewanella sp. OMA3-2]UJF22851.1 peptide deformylase [Shewanella sp. OMA3-2]